MVRLSHQPRRGDPAPPAYAPNPEIFLKAMAPYRQDLVVAVECRFTWYWLADLCVQEGLTCVLGHASTCKRSTVAKPRMTVATPSRLPCDCEAACRRRPRRIR